MAWRPGLGPEQPEEWNTTKSRLELWALDPEVGIGLIPAAGRDLARA